MENYTGQKVYYLSEVENLKPTAENIALHLFEVFAKKLENFNVEERLYFEIEPICQDRALSIKNTCKQELDSKIQSDQQDTYFKIQLDQEDTNFKIQPNIFNINLGPDNVFNDAKLYDNTPSYHSSLRLSLRSIKVRETPASSAIVEI